MSVTHLPMSPKLFAAFVDDGLLATNVVHQNSIAQITEVVGMVSINRTPSKGLATLSAKCGFLFPASGACTVSHHSAPDFFREKAILKAEQQITIKFPTDISKDQATIDLLPPRIKLSLVLASVMGDPESARWVLNTFNFFPSEGGLLLFEMKSPDIRETETITSEDNASEVPSAESMASVSTNSSSRVITPRSSRDDRKTLTLNDLPGFKTLLDLIDQEMAPTR